MHIIRLVLFGLIVIYNSVIANPRNYDYLIPRSVLFGNPDKTSVRISPNGKYIGYVAPKNGVLNVYVADSENLSNAKSITNDKIGGINAFNFAYDNEHILYLKDNAGDENEVVYSVNIETLEQKNLTASGSESFLNLVSPNFKNEILISNNKRDPRWYDVYRANIKSGETKLLYENNEFESLTYDDNFNLRFAMKQEKSGDAKLYKFDEEQKAEEYFVIPYEDTTETNILGFNKNNDKIYMLDSRNTDTASIFEIDIESKSSRLIYSNDKVDISDLIIHPTEKNILFVAYNYLRGEIKVIDDSLKQDINYLKSIVKGDLKIVSMSLDGMQWIVSDSKDNEPVIYYKYSRVEEATGIAKFLFVDRSSLRNYNLVKMQPIVIKSRDGLDLVSYLSLPIEGAKFPLPMVLSVHGGPPLRDEWGFNPTHQWLANRGYAVLSVNYRGSSGFGKTFLKAGDGQWGAKMHDDLIDSVNWAVKNKIADKEKVAILGRSYGGYAALVGLTFTPDVFACAVDIVGPSNLEDTLSTIPTSWFPRIKYYQIMMGADHTTKEGKEFLATRSPMTYVDKIKKPLLIGQGANDPKVKQFITDKLVEAMKQKSIPITYVVYPDEGHVFRKPENQISFYTITESFLAYHLGGKFADAGCDLKGSSMNIKYGEVFLPKLNEICNKE